MSKNGYLIAGNWKMHKSLEEGRTFLKNFLPLLVELPANVQVAICPQNAALHGLILSWASMAGVAKEKLAFGSQNVHWADAGAFTGELAASLVQEVGAQYAIVGHSERRQFFGESNETAADRAKKAAAVGLTPIFCVGEDLKAREAENTEAVLRAQCQAVFAAIPQAPAAFVFAYEPVWAIGTGKTASSGQAEAAHAYIRRLAVEAWGDDFAQKMPILYGGSVKPQNAEELLACPNVQGALVGGASLEPDTFAAIAAAVK